MFNEPLLTNTCQQLIGVGWGGNCLYTTLRHIMLILTSHFGDDNICSIFAATVPNSANFCTFGLGRMLLFNNGAFIKVWDSFCKAKGIDHIPTLQGIVSGLAKLANRGPISCDSSDALKEAIIGSTVQLSSLEQNDLICNIILSSSLPQKPKWAAGLLILGSHKHDIYVCIGFSDINLGTKAPTACHTEIIGIWRGISSLPPGTKLPTTYHNVQIPLSLINPAPETKEE
jgi:hypothetical protein